MAITFASLTRENAPAARALLLHFWQQNWCEEFACDFFEWRYWARPSGEARLALDGGRCIAIVDSFIRIHLVDRHPVAIRECCDWFCLPEYRPLGIGLKLMRQLMAKPEPLISIGGSAATLALLPRLKWQRLQDVGEYVLPVSARSLAAALLRRFRLGNGAAARFLPVELAIRRPHAVAPPAPGARVRTWTRGDPLPQPEHYALASLVTDDEREWHAAAPPPFADVMALHFSIDDRPVGVALSRVEPGVAGRRAKLLHLQIGQPAQPVIDWIVSEVAQRLVAKGAEMIRCRSSCPMISEALRRTGFLGASPSQTYWWPADRTPPPGPIHLTYSRADDGVPFSSPPPNSQTMAEWVQQPG